MVCDTLVTGGYDGLVRLVGFGLVLSDWKLPNRKAQEVEAHVSVACLLCFKGVGQPCFCLL